MRILSAAYGAALSWSTAVITISSHLLYLETQTLISFYEPNNLRNEENQVREWEEEKKIFKPKRNKGAKTVLFYILYLRMSMCFKQKVPLLKVQLSILLPHDSPIQAPSQRKELIQSERKHTHKHKGMHRPVPLRPLSLCLSLSLSFFTSLFFLPVPRCSSGESPQAV